MKHGAPAWPCQFNVDTGNVAAFCFSSLASKEEFIKKQYWLKMKVSIFRYLSVLFFLLEVTTSSAQSTHTKPNIDTGMLYGWPRLPGVSTALSPNGQYAVFMVENYPKDSMTLMVKDIRGTMCLERKTPSIHYNFYISQDSKKLCWQKGDSLFVQFLGDSKTLLAVRVSQYWFPSNNRGEWIAYRELGGTGRVTLMNVQSGQQTAYEDVNDVYFDEKGRHLLLGKRAGENASLVWVSLTQSPVRMKTIWTSSKGELTSGYRFDPKGTALAFLVRDSMRSSVYYYRIGADIAVRRVEGGTPETGGQVIQGVEGFNTNGQWLF
ncbi:MAG TPA: hypothetical protein VI233_11405, partial [Puia sp.]